MRTTTLMLLALIAAGCSKPGRPLSVALDVYLHPEAGSSEDVLLQTAIRQQLKSMPGIYARVLDRHVMLTGSAKDEATRAKAIDLAKSTSVTVSGGAAVTPATVNADIAVK